MSHSIYLQLATVLIKADLKRETRAFQKKLRRSAFQIPWNNKHLLKDIGLDSEGRANMVSEPDAVKAERRVLRLRQVLSMRIPT